MNGEVIFRVFQGWGVWRGFVAISLPLLPHYQTSDFDASRYLIKIPFLRISHKIMPDFLVLSLYILY